MSSSRSNRSGMFQSKWKKAGSVIRFANRLQSAQKARDEVTAHSADAFISVDVPASSSRPPLAFARRRLLQEERAAKMEDSGIFETRLGLKQRSRETLLSARPRHSGSGRFSDEVLSPSSMDSDPHRGTTPLPPRRRISRADSSGLKSPISRERKLAEEEDSDDETASSVGSFERRRQSWAPRRTTAAATPAMTGSAAAGGSAGIRARRPSAPAVTSASRAKAMKAMKAIMFANRLSGTTAARDRDTAAAAAAALPLRGPPAPSNALLRRTVLDDEAAASAEAAGVFESRLGLRERTLGRRSPRDLPHHGGHRPSSRLGRRLSASERAPPPSDADTVADIGRNLLRRL